jgi:anti-sigma factor RsiW
MNCKDFQDWLLTRDALTDKENPEVLEHLKFCETCRNLYHIDESLEKAIGSAFRPVEFPKSLYERIELTIDHAKIPAGPTKRHFAGLAVGIAASIVLVLVVMIFSNQPFRYENLQQLTESAITRHLSGNTTMSFTADGIESAVTMLSRELKFNVILPDLTNQGYVLLGGRLCVLGKCRIAYLFYEKHAKTCSMFIMDYGNLDFEMADGARFSNDLKGCHTDIWKEKGQVYAMVY